MSSESLKEWMAFFSLEDKEYKEKLQAQVSREQQEQMTQEQLVMQMQTMLMGLKDGK